MTDNEIKEGLRCCASNEFLSNTCDDCPYDYKVFKYARYCNSVLSNDALDFINRQQAEIERLKQNGTQVEVSKKIESEIKAEAIKEFAERLKPRIDCEYGNKFYRDKCYEEIDNLIKEMAGDAE